MFSTGLSNSSNISSSTSGVNISSLFGDGGNLLKKSDDVSNSSVLRHRKILSPPLESGAFSDAYNGQTWVNDDVNGLVGISVVELFADTSYDLSAKKDVASFLAGTQDDNVRPYPSVSISSKIVSGERYSPSSSLSYNGTTENIAFLSEKIIEKEKRSMESTILTDVGTAQLHHHVKAGAEGGHNHGKAPSLAEPSLPRGWQITAQFMPSLEDFVRQVETDAILESHHSKINNKKVSNESSSGGDKEAEFSYGLYNSGTKDNSDDNNNRKKSESVVSEGLRINTARSP